MIFRLGSARGMSIRATDGTIGTVRDVYFDDATWRIRYAVVDTGGWLSGRKVLLVPDALGRMDIARGELAVNLTRDQVANSPDIDTDKPISRQQETRLYDYYGWSPYWYGGMGARMIPAIPPAGAVPDVAPGVPAETARDPVAAEVAAREREQADPNLRSAEEVTGYYIRATDGDIGHVEDFLADDDAWTIRYMIVDTRNWLPGRKVLVSPQWIESIAWNDNVVRIDLTQEQIRNSPEYDPSRALDRAYEARLFESYGRVPYW